jgi:glyoxylase-like metal-dependent hydrolase (beta-lactamase superfamily II)
MPLLIRALSLGSVETNCYVVGCAASRDGFVIDPADEAPRILAVVRELGLTIRAVLVTHAHFDHIMAASDVVAATGAPVGLHPDDLDLYRHGGGATLFGLPAPVVPEPGLALAEGDRLRLGSYSFDVLLTPGHSRGHVSFYEASAGVVFSGDVLFAGGIGRTDLPGQDHETLLASIRTKLAPLPGATRVFPGHGPPTTIAQELASNPWLDD